MNSEIICFVSIYFTTKKKRGSSILQDFRQCSQKRNLCTRSLLHSHRRSRLPPDNVSYSSKYSNASRLQLPPVLSAISSAPGDGGGYGGCVAAFGLFALICPRLGCSPVPLAAWFGMSLFLAPDRHRVSPAKLTRRQHGRIKKKGDLLCSWSRAANNNAPLSCPLAAAARGPRAGSGDHCVPRGTAEESAATCRLRVEPCVDSREHGVARLFPCTCRAARRARQGTVAARGLAPPRCELRLCWVCRRLGRSCVWFSTCTPGRTATVT